MKYRMYDLIEKKKHKIPLTLDEIRDMILAYTAGEIPDYQMSAFLMAVWFQGMTDEELSHFTLAMAASGDELDLSRGSGVKLDKHSTGGVGDKTTLVVAPVLAALGVPTAKMSGRGLGFTGGTVDKLESIPGLRSELTEEEFLRILRTVGFVDAAQTKELAPADKLLYALRDVTATIDSIPLIASSIMSKKLASGADKIVLDVKCGSGAFMRDISSAKALAGQMIRIGEHTEREITAVISDMDQPLGRAVGNALEVMESVEVLKGGGEERLVSLCIALAVEMLQLSDKARPTREEAEGAVKEILQNGAALDRFRAYVREAGGDPAALDRTQVETKYRKEILSDREGYLFSCNAGEVGLVSVLLGAGRAKKGDPIDPESGILLKKKLGDHIGKGEVLAEIFTNREDVLETAEERLLRAYLIKEEPPEAKGVIIDILHSEPI